MDKSQFSARGDVELLAKRPLYEGFFKVIEYQLRFRLFGGSWSAPVTREIFERGHAVAVLPYDPVRDEVVLIEQFRPGAYAAGAEPWLIEIPAGMIAKGETAEAVAMRETAEETGLRINQLKHICGYYVSPGGTSEYVDLFCAQVDAAQALPFGGLDSETEDIKVTPVPVATAMDLLDQNRINNSVALAALLWFRFHHQAIRTAWQG